jgi:hypothetical protein
VSAARLLDRFIAALDPDRIYVSPAAAKAAMAGRADLGVSELLARARGD